MKRRWLVMAVLVTVTLGGAVLPAGPAEKVEGLLRDLRIVPLVPEAAPPFTARDLAETSVSLADFRGRPVLLYFWATW